MIKYQSTHCLDPPSMGPLQFVMDLPINKNFDFDNPAVILIPLSISYSLWKYFNLKLARLGQVG
jgi:hypothetical protein